MICMDMNGSVTKGQGDEYMEFLQVPYEAHGLFNGEAVWGTLSMVQKHLTEPQNTSEESP